MLRTAARLGPRRLFTVTKPGSCPELVDCAPLHESQTPAAAAVVATTAPASGAATLCQQPPLAQLQPNQQQQQPQHQNHQHQHQHQYQHHPHQHHHYQQGQPPNPMERKPLAPPGYSRTFYKRQLPSPPAIEFASDRGKQVFAQALAAGTMNNFFKLIEQFRTQDEPAYCGLASLAMTLNTLNIDPRRTWKGPWRWFHEEMLDCCHPLPKVREEGITLTQAACLARCNGARVELYPYGSISLEEFRGMVAEACSTAEQHIIVSYSRKEFLQTGDGHFSPIGGYSAAEDLVLILDTARFKYPPHWVPLSMLYHAMARIDPATGRPRGFMRMGRHPRLDSVLFTLDVRDKDWREASRYALEELGSVAAVAAAAPGATAQDVVLAAAEAAPLPALRKFVAVRTAGSNTHGGVCIQTAAVHTFLRELRGMPLFAAVAAALPSGGAAAEAASDTNGSDGSSSSGGGGGGSSGHVDVVPVFNCYTPPPGAAAASCALQDAQQQQKQQQQHPLPHPSSPPTHQHHQHQQQSNGDTDLRATAAASSSPALAASSAEPAVKEDLTLERVCMLLLMCPKEVWQRLPGEGLRKDVLGLLDTSMHSVVGAEVEYLSAQLWQLPIMQQALEESEASGHTCAGDMCAAGGCGTGSGEEDSINGSTGGGGCGTSGGCSAATAADEVQHHLQQQLHGMQLHGGPGGFGGPTPGSGGMRQSQQSAHAH